MSWHLLGQWTIASIQTLLFVALAPLFTSWVSRLKSWLENRTAAPLLQPYRDLWRLFGKHMMMAENASLVYRGTPYIVAGAILLAASVVPLLVVHLVTSATADVIALAGFFALARFFQALAGMDVGTAFGGMGSSREMTLSALAEPAMLMAVFTLSLIANSTNLSTVIQYNLSSGLVVRPSMMFALLSLLLVSLAETGRIPVDNPNTHLELTMIHEAMILEYGGRHLALLEWAAQIKLLIYAVLIVNIFFPWGIAVAVTPSLISTAALLLLMKLALLGAVLAVAETSLAKMRLFQAPEFLTLALTLALIGLLSHIILEVN